MSNSLPDVLRGSTFLEDLMYDVATGGGNEILECPDASNIPEEQQACMNEFISFWGGKPTITKCELFLAILMYCNNDVLFSQLADVIWNNYPQFQPKLQSASLSSLFGGSAAGTDKVIPPKPHVKKAESTPVVSETPDYDVEDIPEAPAANKAPFAKSSSKAKSPEYLAFIESKKAENELRKAVNS